MLRTVKMCCTTFQWSLKTKESYICSIKHIAMSLTNQNNQKGKGGKNHPEKFRDKASKFIGKPVKGAGFSKKPVKTGGTRGS